MKHTVRIEIDAPRDQVAALFADPTNGEKWMEDTDYEPLSGTPGAVGSKYRLVQKDGSLTFTATVVARDLPDRVVLSLESDRVDVVVTATFTSLAPRKTALTSEEVFRFRGVAGKVMGLLARPAIARAHRRQMESFKRWVEATAG